MTRLVLATLALAMLAGCGIKGGLERPDPLWNSDEAIAAECRRQAEENVPPSRRDPRCAGRETGAQTPQ
jgi:predicted small lipoprotein YifL